MPLLSASVSDSCPLTKLGLSHLQIKVKDMLNKLGSLRDYVVFDIETTGLKPDSAQVTEIGAVKVSDGKVIAEFSTLINPGTVIPAHITQITGISQEMVKDSPSINQVLPEFLNFSAGFPLVAHNAKFDLSFIEYSCEQLSLAWQRPLVVDTLFLARQIIPRGTTQNYKLQTLSNFLGCTSSPSHRALQDALTTHEVLTELTALALGEAAF